MKVKEVIEALKGCNPEAEVFVARDPEWNGIWRSRYAFEGYYYDGDVYEEADQDLEGIQERYPDQVEKAVVISP